MPNQTIAYDQDFLNRFEEGLNPIDPDHSRIPAHVLGYGEMSTVMTISGANPNLVFKRMPMFHNTSELESYLKLYSSYLHHLTAAGINVVPASITSVVPAEGNVVVYIIQERQASNALVNKAIHNVPIKEIEHLFNAILRRIGQVFTYNDANDGQVAIGIDAQMSNWTIVDYDDFVRDPQDSLELIYIDTSSPLLRLGNQEQLNPELFLRAAPSFLRWIIRLMFVDDLLTRYYQRRQVIIDVLANLYKEKRPDMIPALLVTANKFLEQHNRGTPFKPITQQEVNGYYKEDARIWSIYLTFRRLDRQLHRLFCRPYPYVLPGHVAR